MTDILNKFNFSIYRMAKFNSKSEKSAYSVILVGKFTGKSLTFALQKFGIYVRSYKNRRSAV